MIDKGLSRAVRFDAGLYGTQAVQLSDGLHYELETLPLYAAVAI